MIIKNGDFIVSYKSDLISKNILLTKPYNVLYKQFIDKGKYSIYKTFCTQDIVDLYGMGIKLVNDFDFKSNENDTIYDYYPDSYKMGVYSLLNPSDPISLYHDVNLFCLKKTPITYHEIPIEYTDENGNTNVVSYDIIYDAPTTFLIPNDKILYTIKGSDTTYFFTKYFCGVAKPFLLSNSHYIYWYLIVKDDNTIFLSKDMYLKYFGDIFDVIIKENQSAFDFVVGNIIKSFTFYTAFSGITSILSGIFSLSSISSTCQVVNNISQNNDMQESNEYSDKSNTKILYSDDNLSVPTYKLPDF